MKVEAGDEVVVVGGHQASHLGFLRTQVLSRYLYVYVYIYIDRFNTSDYSLDSAAWFFLIPN